MRRAALATLVALTSLAPALAQNPVALAEQRPDTRAKNFAIPLAFEPNVGQSDSQARFISRGRGYTLFLTGDGMVLSIRSQDSGVRSQNTKWRVASDKWQGETGLLHSPFTIQNSSFPQPPAPSTQNLTPESVSLKLVGANPHPKIIGLDKLPGISNYFIGNDPNKWRTRVPNYARVLVEDVYPGIDMVFYGKDSGIRSQDSGGLEYDFVVHPGADPGAIRLAVGTDGVRPPEGERRSPLRIDVSGDMVIPTGAGDIRLGKPSVYQSATDKVRADGVRPAEGECRSPLRMTPNSELVSGNYVLTAKNELRFALGDYDRTKTLVIDPVLAYSTYLGGSNYDFGFGIAVDPSGSAYIVGTTYSTNFPTENALQPSYGGGSLGDAFVTKFDASGSTLVYSTYIGGSGEDQGAGIALDSDGFVYIAGQTTSTNFPTNNAFQSSLLGSTNAFVAKLDPSGSALVFSTYLGGSGGDGASAIAIDASGNSYVTGSTFSTDFPVMNAFQVTYGGGLYSGDAFVTEFNATGSALVYSTYLGGSQDESGTGIALDASGNTYVTGTTQSSNFPTVNPFQSVFGGGTCGGSPSLPCNDAFVAKIASGGGSLVYSTYLGGSVNDVPRGIAVDSDGNAFVDGLTTSTNFPIKNAFQPSPGPNPNNAFVTELDPTGASLIFSTYLGGSVGASGSNSNSTGAQAIALDASGDIYITGFTSAFDFPTVDPIQASNTTPLNGGDNAFVSEFNPGATALLFSTFLGCGNDSGFGIAVDSVGSIYVTGYTYCAGFPTVNPFQAGFHGVSDAFVAKISRPPKVVLGQSSLTFSGQLIGTTSAAQTATLTNSGESPLTIQSIAASGDFVESDDCPLSPSTLAIDSDCTISVTFAPTVRGTRSGAITITDNAPDTPQKISLTGTGLSGPTADLSPTTLTFPNQYVGTTGLPLTVTVTNNGDSPLTISNVTTSVGDFGVLNACTSKVDAGVSCAIGVFFDPAQSGTRSGQLTVADDATDSPQSVSLSGVGQDFSLTSSSSSTSVAAGQIARYDIRLSPTPSFNGTVNLTCSGIPPMAQCNITPTSVSLKGADPGLATVNVATASPSSLLPLPSNRIMPRPRYFVLVFGLGLLLMAGTMFTGAGRRRSPARGFLRPSLGLAATIVAAMLLAPSCGGGGGVPSGGTPSGKYFLQISGTATTSSGTGSLSHNVVLTLTVQ